MIDEHTATLPQGVVRFYNFLPADNRYFADVLAGLALPRKCITLRYGFDDSGRRMYAALCEQPEYYLVRSELAILRENLDAVAEYIGPDAQLIEVRAGIGVQTALLLERLRPSLYVPIDIDARALQAAAGELAELFPWLNISGMRGDAAGQFVLPEFAGVPIRRKAVLLPGSVIGNFAPEDALAVLRNARQFAGTGGLLLAGIDLKKDAGMIESAYNDANGTGAALHLNLLRRINRELNGDLRPGRFAYRAAFDADRGCIETSLESRYAQFAHIGGRRFDFAPNERVSTGIACQYSVEEFIELAGEAGFVSQALWTDAAKTFSVHGMIAV